MNKYMVLYTAPIPAEEQMSAARTPEEAKKGMEPWLAWQKKNGKAVVDMGSPLGRGAHLEGKVSSKAKTNVTGYTIIQAKDMDEAKAILADHPIYMMPKAGIEVFEIMPMAM